MAPQWARAARPLVIIFTLIAFVITIIFQADVDAQGGAYATGVLVLITSAAVAVTLSARRKQQRKRTIAFGVISVVFVYTTVANVIERPDGVRIAAIFIIAIVVGVARLARAAFVRAPCVVDRARRHRPAVRRGRRRPVQFGLHHRERARCRHRRGVPGEGARGTPRLGHPGPRADDVPRGPARRLLRLRRGPRRRGPRHPRVPRAQGPLRQRPEHHRVDAARHPRHRRGRAEHLLRVERGQPDPQRHPLRVHRRGRRRPRHARGPARSGTRGQPTARASTCREATDRAWGVPPGPSAAWRRSPSPQRSGAPPGPRRTSRPVCRRSCSVR